MRRGLPKPKLTKSSCAALSSPFIRTRSASSHWVGSVYSLQVMSKSGSSSGPGGSSARDAGGAGGSSGARSGCVASATVAPCRNSVGSVTLKSPASGLTIPCTGNHAGGPTSPTRSGGSRTAMTRCAVSVPSGIGSASAKGASTSAEVVASAPTL